MRDDLLHAKACVDWTEAQLPSLEKRINAWLDLNLHVEVVDAYPSEPDNVIIAAQKETLPLSFNVEFGAYINVLRNSLDILATTIAHRYGVPNPENVYFPVAGTEAAFVAGTSKKAEFVKRLPDTPRKIIEALKPYKGGNRDLWALHQLDIMRKHRKLLTVTISNRSFHLIGSGFREHYSPLPDGFRPFGDNKSIVGLIRKGAPDYEMKFSGQVTISEATLFDRKPVIAALREFSRLANLIIDKFDIP